MLSNILCSLTSTEITNNFSLFKLSNVWCLSDFKSAYLNNLSSLLNSWIIHTFSKKWSGHSESTKWWGVCFLSWAVDFISTNGWWPLQGCQGSTILLWPQRPNHLNVDQFLSEKIYTVLQKSLPGPFIWNKSSLIRRSVGEGMFKIISLWFVFVRR